jgi:rhodanese-related sulfurtransferase
MAGNGEATPAEAYNALRDQGAALVDVREPWEYEQASIPGAVLIPLGEVPQRLEEIPSDRDVYVHCRMGGRSARAVAFLREHGRPRTHNVAGGIEAWKEAGLPVSE